MEDSRRPFTPLIEHESYTPERSQSPRAKPKQETSSSPPRKTLGGKEAPKESLAKKDSKEGKTSASKKGTNANGGTSSSLGNKEAATEETTKSRASKNKGIIKENKDNKDGDETGRRDDTDTAPPPPSTSSKVRRMSVYDSAYAAKTQDSEKNLDDLNTARPDSHVQMRAESALSYQPPSIVTETGYVPFSIEPAFGKIEAGKTQVFKIKFSPLNTNEYQARLMCHISNLEEHKLGPIVAVKGKSTLPYCHFDLEESDYLSAGRRNPELPGPDGAASGLGIDSSTKVIEFKSIGVGTKCTKTFKIINPLNADYEYEWTREDQNDLKKGENFTCQMQSGVLKSGRNQDVGFEFVPNEVGIRESFWKFKIPKYNLCVPFLLLGEVSEPKIVFDRSYVMFKPILVGLHGLETVHLINQENKQFTYQFDSNSCYTEGRSTVLLVEPLSGLIEPNTRIPISLKLTTKEAKQLAFNLKCHLSCSTRPLHLNVKAEGFSMQTSLYCEDLNGSKIEFNPDGTNEIHLGEVEKNEIAYRNFFLLNTGKYPVEFACNLKNSGDNTIGATGKLAVNSSFSIEPKSGYIEPGDKHNCLLKFHAKREKPVSAMLSIGINNGATYKVYLDGIAVKPDVNFSFVQYDFGATLVYKAGMPVRTCKLNVTNTGAKDISVDSLFDNPASNCFTVDFKQVILAAGESASACISFIPRENREYNEKVVFELNGLTRREVHLHGTGTDMNIEVFNAKDRVIDFGALQAPKVQNGKAGVTKTMPVRIVNRSLATIDFNVVFEAKNDRLAQDKSMLTITPAQQIKLKANQTIDLDVTFAPKERIPRFTEDVFVEYHGLQMPLLTITGAYHGYNIGIDTSTVQFGAVMQKCSVTKRLVMQNVGDIGASFKWESDKMRPEFSISPETGYISPAMEINFDITFSPTEISQDIRKDNIKCLLEGCNPLKLTLLGSCVQIVPVKEVQHFETFVRQRETKQIAILNRTNSMWEIRPAIEGEYFTGPEVIVIEPQSSKGYEVTYYPLTMAIEGKKHFGSCFFPLPDGTGLLYTLSGISGTPKPVGRIQKDIPCKINTIELIPIENWLKKPQRFRVLIEAVKPDRFDLSTTAKGHDYIDVPANEKRDYKLNYFAHKEGAQQMKVTFKNEHTGEYVFYEVVFKVVKGGSMGSIDLTTLVRTPVSYSLKLDNPLPNQVTFAASCTNTADILIPSNLQISSKAQVR
jgi:hydrocephalus-inducing protein